MMDLIEIRRKHAIPKPEDALPGRDEAMRMEHAHTVLGNSLEHLSRHI